MIRHVAPLAGILLLAGCAFVGPEGFETKLDQGGNVYGLTSLEVLSVVNTKKTVADHLATWITGKDCSTLRAQREGAWCVEWPAPPAPPAQLY
jgi:hypothetical protein